MCKIIDIHCHINHGVPGEPVDTEIEKSNLEFLLAERARLGVGSVALTTYDAVIKTENIERENTYLREIVEKNENIFQWVVVDPQQPNTFVQAEKLLQMPRTLGVKIHSVCHKYDLVAYADKIFEFSSKHNAVVMMHPDCMQEMVAIMDNYPKARLIISHLGSLEHVVNIEKAKYGNIYTDTSGCFSYFNNVVEYAVDRVGSEKILFGTDAYSVAFQLGRIVYANIKEEDKENILYRNAKSIFKI